MAGITSTLRTRLLNRRITHSATTNSIKDYIENNKGTREDFVKNLRVLCTEINVYDSVVRARAGNIPLTAETEEFVKLRELYNSIPRGPRDIIECFKGENLDDKETKIRYQFTGNTDYQDFNGRTIVDQAIRYLRDYFKQSKIHSHFQELDEEKSKQGRELPRSALLTTPQTGPGKFPIINNAGAREPSDSLADRIEQKDKPIIPGKPNPYALQRNSKAGAGDMDPSRPTPEAPDNPKRDANKFNRAARDAIRAQGGVQAFKTRTPMPIRTAQQDKDYPPFDRENPYASERNTIKEAHTDKPTPDYSRTANMQRDFKPAHPETPVAPENAGSKGVFKRSADRLIQAKRGTNAFESGAGRTGEEAGADEFDTPTVRVRNASADKPPSKPHIPPRESDIMSAVDALEPSSRSISLEATGEPSPAVVRQQPRKPKHAKKDEGSQVTPRNERLKERKEVTQDDEASPEPSKKPAKPASAQSKPVKESKRKEKEESDAEEIGSDDEDDDSSKKSGTQIASGNASGNRLKAFADNTFKAFSDNELKATGVDLQGSSLVGAFNLNLGGLGGVHFGGKKDKEQRKHREEATSPAPDVAAKGRKGNFVGAVEQTMAERRGESVSGQENLLSPDPSLEPSPWVDPWNPPMSVTHPEVRGPLTPDEQASLEATAAYNAEASARGPFVAGTPGSPQQTVYMQQTHPAHQAGYFLQPTQFLQNQFPGWMPQTTYSYNHSQPFVVQPMGMQPAPLQRVESLPPPFSRTPSLQPARLTPPAYGDTMNEYGSISRDGSWVDRQNIKSKADILNDEKAIKQIAKSIITVAADQKGKATYTDPEGKQHLSLKLKGSTEAIEKLIISKLSAIPPEKLDPEKLGVSAPVIKSIGKTLKNDLFDFSPGSMFSGAHICVKERIDTGQVSKAISDACKEHGIDDGSRTRR